MDKIKKYKTIILLKNNYNLILNLCYNKVKINYNLNIFK